ncbi:MAG TPA: beta-1,3-glucanase family protein, partial [Terrimicrobiaceae bacterium]
MKKPIFFKTAASLCAIGAVGLAVSPLAQALNLTVVNQNPNYTDDQVYVRFQDVSCGGIQNNKSYKLSELPKPMVISRAAGRIFVSLGEPLQSNGPDFFDCPPSANAAQHHDYNTRWDKVEWTIDNSPTQCANLSSSDFFSVPLQISDGSRTLK